MNSLNKFILYYFFLPFYFITNLFRKLIINITIIKLKHLINNNFLYFEVCKLLYSINLITARDSYIAIFSLITLSLLEKSCNFLNQTN